MRFRPANIRLINRRSNLPRLLLALSSRKGNGNYKNNPADLAELTRSLHIRAMNSLTRFWIFCRHPVRTPISDLALKEKQERIVRGPGDFFSPATVVQT
jgi:hypothetical protein